MTLGPVMLDIAGTELTPEDEDILAHPQCGGVILFTRNHDSPEQLTALTRAIHDARKPPLLIAVDQEGGRVQRFRDGFTALPAAALIGRVHDQDVRAGRILAERCGWLMAAELRAVGVDFSFAPVVDLDGGVSAVIGDRAFHADPEVIAALAVDYVAGMRAAGMAGVAKHYPGHGSVAPDSHETLPIDRRPLADLADDLRPFERMMAAGVPGIMAAHILYPEIDPHPAGFSRWWLQDVLRRRNDYRGVVFSDDLSMKGAAMVGDVVQCAAIALDAGCDMVLVCNDREGAGRVLESLERHTDPASQIRLVRMHGRRAPDRGQLLASDTWSAAADLITRQCAAAQDAGDAVT